MYPINNEFIGMLPRYFLLHHQPNCSVEEFEPSNPLYFSDLFAGFEVYYSTF
jgi:hypothetical protein